MELKEIPGTVGFLAGRDGKVYGPEGGERTTYLNGDGYVTVTVLTTAGIWVTFGVHRLVALTWYPVEEASLLTVNHIDGVLTNNHVDNLEWATAKFNNVHAALMQGSLGRDRMLATHESGSQMFLADLAGAADYFNTDPQTVWSWVKDSTRHDGWLLTHHGSRDRIPEALKKQTLPLRDVSGRAPVKAVKMKNVDSGLVEFHESMNAAARVHSVSASHVYQCMFKPHTPRLFKKLWVVVYSDEMFPDVPLEHLALLKDRGAKAVIAYDHGFETYTIYGSASQFIKQENLSKKAVTTRLAAGVPKELPGTKVWFMYHSDTAHTELKQAVQKKKETVA